MSYRIGRFQARCSGRSRLPQFARRSGAHRFHSTPLLIEPFSTRFCPLRACFYSRSQSRALPLPLAPSRCMHSSAALCSPPLNAAPRRLLNALTPSTSTTSSFTSTCLEHISTLRPLTTILIINHLVLFSSSRSSDYHSGRAAPHADFGDRRSFSFRINAAPRQHSPLQSTPHRHSYGHFAWLVRSAQLWFSRCSYAQQNYKLLQLIDLTLGALSLRAATRTHCAHFSSPQRSLSIRPAASARYSPFSGAPHFLYICEPLLSIIMCPFTDATSLSHPL